MTSKNLLKRSIAGLVLFAFCLNTILPPGYAQSTPAVSKPVSIPETFGKVEESFQGSSGKKIFYIQDAHDSLEAQENIAKMIHHLVEHAGVTTVFEEGYEGRVPTDKFFGKIPNKKIREKTAYFLMDKLRLGGAEYAHITRTKNFELIGADNLKLHKENTAFYQESSKHQPETESALTVLDTEIRALTQRYFTKDLKTWMVLKEKSERGEITLIDYLKRMNGLLAPVSEFKTISRILAMASGKQRAQDDIDVHVLFSEMNRLEERFAQSQLSETRDRELFHYYQSLQLFKRLNRLEVTEEEFEAVREKIKTFSTDRIAKFIAEQSGHSVVLPKIWEMKIQSAIRFYEAAKERDTAIEKALLSVERGADSGQEKAALNAKRQTLSSAILVFGGFHKENIKSILRKNGFSYEVISPAITSLSPKHQNYYKQLMRWGYDSGALPVLAAKATTAARELAFPDTVIQPMLDRISSLALKTSGKDGSASLAEMDLLFSRTEMDLGSRNSAGARYEKRDIIREVVNELDSKTVSDRSYEAFLLKYGFQHVRRGTYHSRPLKLYFYNKGEEFSAETKESALKKKEIAETLTKAGMLNPETRWGIFQTRPGYFALYAVSPEMEAVSKTWLAEGLNPPRKDWQPFMRRKDHDALNEDTDHWHYRLVTAPESHVNEWIHRIVRDFNPSREIPENVDAAAVKNLLPQKGPARFLDLSDALTAINWGWDKETGILYPVDIEVLALSPLSASPVTESRAEARQELFELLQKNQWIQEGTLPEKEEDADAFLSAAVIQGLLENKLEVMRKTNPGEQARLYELTAKLDLNVSASHPSWSDVVQLTTKDFDPDVFKTLLPRAKTLASQGYQTQIIYSKETFRVGDDDENDFNFGEGEAYYLHISEVRKLLRELAESKGLPTSWASDIGDIAHELIFNMLDHARAGVFAVKVIEQNGEPLMEMTGWDMGDGIHDPERLRRESAARSAGGIGFRAFGDMEGPVLIESEGKKWERVSGVGFKYLSNDSEIHPGDGTKITMQIPLGFIPHKRRLSSVNQKPAETPDTQQGPYVSISFSKTPAAQARRELVQRLESLPDKGIITVQLPAWGDPQKTLYFQIVKWNDREYELNTYPDDPRTGVKRLGYIDFKIEKGEVMINTLFPFADITREKRKEYQDLKLPYSAVWILSQIAYEKNVPIYHEGTRNPAAFSIYRTLFADQYYFGLASWKNLDDPMFPLYAAAGRVLVSDGKENIPVTLGKSSSGTGFYTVTESERFNALKGRTVSVDEQGFVLVHETTTKRLLGRITTFTNPIRLRGHLHEKYLEVQNPSGIRHENRSIFDSAAELRSAGSDYFKRSEVLDGELGSKTQNYFDYSPGREELHRIYHDYIQAYLDLMLKVEQAIGDPQLLWIYPFTGIDAVLPYAVSGKVIGMEYYRPEGTDLKGYGIDNILENYLNLNRDQVRKKLANFDYRYLDSTKLETYQKLRDAHQGRAMLVLKESGFGKGYTNKAILADVAEPLFNSVLKEGDQVLILSKEGLEKFEAPLLAAGFLPVVRETSKGNQKIRIRTHGYESIIRLHVPDAYAVFEKPVRSESRYETLQTLLANIPPTRELPDGSQWEHIAVLDLGESGKSLISVRRTKDTSPVNPGQYTLWMGDALSAEINPDGKVRDREGYLDDLMEALAEGVQNPGAVQAAAEKSIADDKASVAAVILEKSFWEPGIYEQLQQQLAELAEMNSHLEGVKKDQVSLALFLKVVSAIYTSFGEGEITALSEIKGRYGAGSIQPLFKRGDTPETTFLNVDEYQKLGGNHLEFFNNHTLEIIDDPDHAGWVRFTLRPRYAGKILKAGNYYQFYKTLLEAGIPVFYDDPTADGTENQFSRIYLGEYNVKFELDSKKYPLFPPSETRAEARKVPALYQTALKTAYEEIQEKLKTGWRPQSNRGSHLRLAFANHDLDVQIGTALSGKIAIVTHRDTKFPIKALIDLEDTNHILMAGYPPDDKKAALYFYSGKDNFSAVITGDAPSKVNEVRRYPAIESFERQTLRNFYDDPVRRIAFISGKAMNGEVTMPDHGQMIYVRQGFKMWFPNKLSAPVKWKDLLWFHVAGREYEPTIFLSEPAVNGESHYLLLVPMGSRVALYNENGFVKYFPYGKTVSGVKDRDLLRFFTLARTGSLEARRENRTEDETTAANTVKRPEPAWYGRLRKALALAEKIKPELSRRNKDSEAIWNSLQAIAKTVQEDPDFSHPVQVSKTPAEYISLIRKAVLSKKMSMQGTGAPRPVTVFIDGDPGVKKSAFSALIAKELGVKTQILHGNDFIDQNEESRHSADYWKSLQAALEGVSPEVECLVVEGFRIMDGEKFLHRGEQPFPFDYKIWLSADAATRRKNIRAYYLTAIKNFPEDSLTVSVEKSMLLKLDEKYFLRRIQSGWFDLMIEFSEANRPDLIPYDLHVSRSEMRSEIKFYSEFELEKEFGASLVAPSISRGSKHPIHPEYADFLFDQSGKKIAVRMIYSKFVFRPLDDEGNEILDRVIKVTYKNPDNEMVLDEARHLLKIQAGGSDAGTPVLLRLGLLKEGGAWIEMKSIPNARSFEREIFGSVPRLFNVLIRAGEIVANVNRQKIAHGDLKPQQFLINNEQEIQLIDFGNSVAIPAEKEVSRATPRYVPRDENGDPMYAEYAEDTDVYSFIMMISELLEHQIRNPATEISAAVEKMREEYLHMILKSWSFKTIGEMLMEPLNDAVQPLPRKKWPKTMEPVLEKLRSDLKIIQEISTRHENRSEASLLQLPEMVRIADRFTDYAEHGVSFSSEQEKKEAAKALAQFMKDNLREFAPDPGVIENMTAILGRLLSHLSQPSYVMTAGDDDEVHALSGFVFMGFMNRTNARIRAFAASSQSRLPGEFTMEALANRLATARDYFEGERFTGETLHKLLSIVLYENLSSRAVNVAGHNQVPSQAFPVIAAQFISQGLLFPRTIGDIVTLEERPVVETKNIRAFFYELVKALFPAENEVNQKKILDLLMDFRRDYFVHETILGEAGQMIFQNNFLQLRHFFRFQPNASLNATGRMLVRHKLLTTRLIESYQKIHSAMLRQGIQKPELTYDFSGPDISTALLLTDAQTLHFNDAIPFLFNVNGQAPESLRFKEIYFTDKATKGYSNGALIESIGSIRLLMEWELEALGARNVRFEKNPQNPKQFFVTFDWSYDGQAANLKPRKIIYTEQSFDSVADFRIHANGLTTGMYLRKADLGRFEINDVKTPVIISFDHAENRPGYKRIPLADLAGPGASSLYLDGADRNYADLRKGSLYFMEEKKEEKKPEVPHTWKAGDKAKDTETGDIVEIESVFEDGRIKLVGSNGTLSRKIFSIKYEPVTGERHEMRKSEDRSGWESGGMEMRMVSLYTMRETFGEARQGPDLSGGRSDDFLYKDKTAVARRVPWANSIYQALDEAGNEIPGRVFKISDYASQNPQLYDEAADLLKLQEVPALKGVSKLLRFGAMKNGGLWIEIEGITNARSLDREVFGKTERLFEVLIQAGEIIKGVHDHGLIHDDIRPSNFLINDADAGHPQEIELINFSGAREKHRQGSSRYIPGYGAVDRFWNPIHEDLQEDVDVYSFVLMAAELFDQQMQSREPERHERFQKIRNKYLRLIFDHWDFDSVQQLISNGSVSMASPLPREDRPQSMGPVLEMLRRDLEAIQNNQPVPEPEPVHDANMERWLGQLTHQLTLAGAPGADQDQAYKTLFEDIESHMISSPEAVRNLLEPQKLRSQEGVDETTHYKGLPLLQKAKPDAENVLRALALYLADRGQKPLISPHEQQQLEAVLTLYNQQPDTVWVQDIPSLFALSMKTYFMIPAEFKKLSYRLKDLPGELGVRAAALSLFMHGVHLDEISRDRDDDFWIMERNLKFIEHKLKQNDLSEETRRMAELGMMRALIFVVPFLKDYDPRQPKRTVPYVENFNPDLYRSLRSFIYRNKTLIEEIYRKPLYYGWDWKADSPDAALAGFSIVLFMNGTFGIDKLVRTELGKKIQVPMDEMFLDREAGSFETQYPDVLNALSQALVPDYYGPFYSRDKGRQRFHNFRLSLLDVNESWNEGRSENRTLEADVSSRSLQETDYSELLRRLNPGTPKLWDVNQNHDFWVEPMRYPELYIQLQRLAQTTEGRLNLLVLGPGRARIPDSNPARYYSPQMVEILTALKGHPADLTVVDADPAVLNTVRSPNWYSLSLKAFNSAMRLFPFAKNLKTLLGNRTGKQIRSRILSGKHTFKLPEFFSSHKVSVFQGYFEELEYGEEQLDAIVATSSLTYALQSAATIEESLDLLARVIKALKPGGQLLVSAGTLTNGVFLNPDKTQKSDFAEWMDQKELHGAGLFEEMGKALQQRLGFEVRIGEEIRDLRVITRPARSEMRSGEQTLASMKASLLKFLDTRDANAKTEQMNQIAAAVKKASPQNRKQFSGLLARLLDNKKESEALREIQAGISATDAGQRSRFRTLYEHLFDEKGNLRKNIPVLITPKDVSSYKDEFTVTVKRKKTNLQIERLTYLTFQERREILSIFSPSNLVNFFQDEMRFGNVPDTSEILVVRNPQKEIVAYSWSIFDAQRKMLGLAAAGTDSAYRGKGLGTRLLIRELERGLERGMTYAKTHVGIDGRRSGLQWRFLKFGASMEGLRLESDLPEVGIPLQKQQKANAEIQTAQAGGYPQNKAAIEKVLKRYPNAQIIMRMKLSSRNILDMKAGVLAVTAKRAEVRSEARPLSRRELLGTTFAAAGIVGFMAYVGWNLPPAKKPPVSRTPHSFIGLPDIDENQPVVLEDIDKTTIARAFSKIWKDPDHPWVRSAQATYEMTHKLMEANPEFLKTRKVTVLYPGSDAHVALLDIAHELIQQKRIDHAEFIFTEINEDSLYYLREILKQLTKHGFYEGMEEGTEKLPPGEEGSETIFKLRYQGKNILIRFALKRSGKDFYRDDYLQRANIYYNHDPGLGVRPHQVFSSLLEHLSRNPASVPDLWMMSEGFYARGWRVTDEVPGQLREASVESPAPAHYHFRTDLFSVPLSGAGIFDAGVWTVPFGFGHRDGVEEERGKYLYPLADIAHLDRAFIQALFKSPAFRPGIPVRQQLEYLTRFLGAFGKFEVSPIDHPDKNSFDHKPSPEEQKKYEHDALTFVREFTESLPAEEFPRKMHLTALLAIYWEHQSKIQDELESAIKNQDLSFVQTAREFPAAAFVSSEMAKSPDFFSALLAEESQKDFYFERKLGAVGALILLMNPKIENAESLRKFVREVNGQNWMDPFKALEEKAQARFENREGSGELIHRRMRTLDIHETAMDIFQRNRAAAHYTDNQIKPRASFGLLRAGADDPIYADYSEVMTLAGLPYLNHLQRMELDTLLAKLSAMESWTVSSRVTRERSEVMEELEKLFRAESLRNQLFWRLFQIQELLGIPAHEGRLAKAVIGFGTEMHEWEPFGTPDLFIPNNDSGETLESAVQAVEYLGWELRLLNDSLARVLPDAQSWVAWHSLHLMNPDEVWVRYVEALERENFDETLLIHAGMKGLHVRQQADVADLQVYPLLISVVLKKLDEALKDMKKGGKLAGPQARIASASLFSLIHIFPRNRTGELDFEIYRSAFQGWMKEVSSRYGVENPEAIFQRAVTLFPDLLKNPDGSLPLYLEFIDKRPDAEYSQTGSEVIELLALWNEMNPGKEINVLDLISGSRNPNVQFFLEERRASLSVPLQSHLLRVRNALLDGSLFIRAEARAQKETRTAPANESVLFVDGAAKDNHPEDRARELAVLAAENPKRLLVVYESHKTEEGVVTVSSLLKTFNYRNIKFAALPFAEAVKPYQFRGQVNLVHYSINEEEAVQVQAAAGESLAKKLTSFVGDAGALGHGLKYLEAVKLKEQEARQSNKPLLGLVAPDIEFRNGHYLVSPQASASMLLLQQAEFAIAFARAA